MAIHTSMLKVDTCTTVLANNNLQLIVPPVCACSNLNAFDNLVRSAEHVLTQLRHTCWLRVVKAQDEECRIDHVETICVVGAFFSGQDISQARPNLPVLGAQHAHRRL